MKSHSAHLRPVAATLLASTALLILGIMGSPPALGAEANPQELREKAEALHAEARELKAGASTSRLRKSCAKPWSFGRKPTGCSVAAARPRNRAVPDPEELKQRLEQARAQFESGARGGPGRGSGPAERQVARMEAVLERSDRPAPEWMRPPREGGPGRGFPGRP
jgi:hypothetical protein